MVVIWAWLLESAFFVVISGLRCSVSFYTSRIYAAVAATVLLLVFLSEMTKLYAQLAHSNSRLRREQNNKLINLEAAIASISHEIRQPLTAMTANSAAALELLTTNPPALEETRLPLNDIIGEGHRANQVLEGVRGLFGTRAPKPERVDMNELTLSALRHLRAELSDHNIVSRVELASNLPSVIGQKSQFEEVIINLVHNAVGARKITISSH